MLDTEFVKTAITLVFIDDFLINDFPSSMTNLTASNGAANQSGNCTGKHSNRPEESTDSVAINSAANSAYGGARFLRYSATGDIEGIAFRTNYTHNLPHFKDGTAS
jgi:hypothetical protein